MRKSSAAPSPLRRPSSQHTGLASLSRERMTRIISRLNAQKFRSFILIVVRIVEIHSYCSPLGRGGRKLKRDFAILRVIFLLFFSIESQLIRFYSKVYENSKRLERVTIPPLNFSLRFQRCIYLCTRKSPLESSKLHSRQDSKFLHCKKLKPNRNFSLL